MNFCQMYQQVVEEIVDAGLAKHMDESVWVDAHGSIVEESYAYGCKVNVNIIDPDWVLVMDEVDGNTNQKGDGMVGVSYN